MNKYRRYIAIVVLIGITHLVYAQTIYKIQYKRDVEIKLMGTSTLHDWEMEAHNATGEAQFVFKSENESALTSLRSLTFNLKVEDLKSDNKVLDKNAYKALRSDEHKKIHYVLLSSTISPEKVGYLLKTNGKLTIAGTTKEISMDIYIVINESRTITCKGAYRLNMSDYDVAPPSFMMGIMKTGDETTLDFQVTYII